jgi:dipeptidyl aminopeptidase/acylaminoacyl peptidase
MYLKTGCSIDSTDEYVPYEQSVHIAHALRQHGSESELIVIQDVGHRFDGNTKGPTVKLALDRVVEYPNKHRYA